MSTDRSRWDAFYAGDPNDSEVGRFPSPLCLACAGRKGGCVHRSGPWIPDELNSGQWCTLHDRHQDDPEHDYLYEACEGYMREATPEEARLFNPAHVAAYTYGEMLVFNEAEAAIDEHIVAAMQGIQDLGLMCNEGELAHAVHTLQLFLIKHMLQRLGSPEFSDWYEKPELVTDEGKGCPGCADCGKTHPKWPDYCHPCEGPMLPW